MVKYQPSEIEKKWQKVWEEARLYSAKDFDKKKKYYVLFEFPYPSGNKLHVGHVRPYAAMDAVARKKRMEGFNVLYPIGWDAFGLPAENYAIKTGVHPSITTQENIDNAKKQVKSWGLSFDWDREVNTTDPKYYKWTQWIFLKLLENDMAYQADVTVNWCPFCKTNLADEEVLPDGTHERCGNMTEKRMQKQWLLRITKYAEKLLEGLKEVDYPDKVRIQQENWIGKSEGVEIDFNVIPNSFRDPQHGKEEMLKQVQHESKRVIKVFTTRVDTIFSGTFLILAPEHPLVEKITTKEQREEVQKYIQKTACENEIDRTNLEKEKTGVFTGAYVINPATKDKMPVWISDFVLGKYGTGAVFADAHDKRDFEMAKKYNLSLKVSIKPEDDNLWEKVKKLEVCFEGDGVLVNSGEFDGQTSEEARINITKWLEKHNAASVSTQYKLRDWVFSRQHYWGEPIPVVYCEKCGIVAVPEKDLPVELPYLEKYQPSGTGKSPLEKIEEWVNTKCPKCDGLAKRETDTMPNWAGSNWYYLRYLDPKNDKVFADKKKMEYWMPVDVYEGGFEHTTLHLLYSRFIYQFLHDIGEVPTKEPYVKRRVNGIVLGPDGRKMSKSFGNVINPDEIVGKFGADALRIYEAFMGPFDQTIAWSEEGVEGCFRFLKRVWQLSNEKTTTGEASRELLAALHKVIQKVSLDMESFKFNTAIAAMMEFINVWQGSEKGLNKEDLKNFLLVLAPFAPHITEELWQTSFSTANKFVSIHQKPWPKFDPKLLEQDEVNIIIQVNGKVRDTVVCQMSEVGNQTFVEEKAKESGKVKQYLMGKAVKKVIYVKGKILNFVVD
jgi:leucyl-tRNA synthetase